MNCFNVAVQYCAQPQRNACRSISCVYVETGAFETTHKRDLNCIDFYSFTPRLLDTAGVCTSALTEAAAVALLTIHRNISLGVTVRYAYRYMFIVHTLLIHVPTHPTSQRTAPQPNA